MTIHPPAKVRGVLAALGLKGLKAALLAVFYDFHCLMNDEVIYKHVPDYVWRKGDNVIDFTNLPKKELEDIDNLARLMLKPDENFHKLKELWQKEKKFRIMSGVLLSHSDHVKYKIT